MDERGIEPDDRTFSAVLLVCATSSMFDRPTREQAFDIAIETCKRAHAGAKLTLLSLRLFFKGAEGLERGSDIEMVYKWCCEAGYENDEIIQQYVKRQEPIELLPEKRLPEKKSQQLSDKEDSGPDTNLNSDLTASDTTISQLAVNGRASEADAVLKVLLDRNIIPDRADFTLVIETWAKSGEKDAAPRAEAILEMMNATAMKEGITNLLPNVASFNSVLSAWTKSSYSVAASNGERILRRMIELDKAGVPNVKPNKISYRTVIDGLANSLPTDAADAADAIGAILGLMIDQYEAGDVNVKPDTEAFNKIINAYSSSKILGA